MTTSGSSSEEESFNVYWKIKNFSYCCETIKSPEFNLIGSVQYFLQLNPGSLDVDCKFSISDGSESGRTRKISFVTCDGSPEVSVSGAQGIHLLVPKEIIFGSRRSSFLPEDTLTVKLQILNEPEKGSLFICSQIGVRQKYFLWTLKNFSNYQGTTVKSIDTSKLYGNINLILKPMNGFDTDEQFGIEISRKGGDRCYCTLKMVVMDVSGNALNEVTDGFVFEKKDDLQTRGFPAFFKKSKLLACKSLILPEDTLSLKCNFAISLGTLKDQTVLSSCEDAIPLQEEFEDLSASFQQEKNSVCTTDLQIDLKSILDEGTLFDVSLQIGTEVIQGHKNILSARSPVFKAMFSNDMRETVSNSVVIEDLDVETVRRLVLYMYTDIMPDCQWEDVKKLYSAADKYEVLSLKNQCVSFLKGNFTTSNVSEALVLADLHEDEDLKSSAFTFISRYDSFLALQVLKEILSQKH